MIKDVENECIIPKDVLQMALPPMATFTMVLTLTRSEYDAALNEGTLIEKGMMLCPNVTELQHSKSLAASVCKVFGEDYTVKCNEQLLPKSLPVCMYATSKPDLVIFHTKNYFYNGRLLGFCSVSPETESVETDSDEEDSDSYVLLGMAGEDKRQERGEKQVIAGMLLLATKLGVNAVNDSARQ